MGLGTDRTAGTWLLAYLGSEDVCDEQGWDARRGRGGGEACESTEVEVEATERSTQALSRRRTRVSVSQGSHSVELTRAVGLVEIRLFWCVEVIGNHLAELRESGIYHVLPIPSLSFMPGRLLGLFQLLLQAAVDSHPPKMLPPAPATSLGKKARCGASLTEPPTPTPVTATCSPPSPLCFMSRNTIFANLLDATHSSCGGGIAPSFSGSHPSGEACTHMNPSRSPGFLPWFSRRCVWRISSVPERHGYSTQNRGN